MGPYSLQERERYPERSMKHLSSFEIFDLYSESWEQRPVTGEGILNNVERAMFAVSVRVSDLCSYCDCLFFREVL